MIVRFTISAVMTRPIKQKRASSGYELLKGDDNLETRGPKCDGSIEELKCWSGCCRAFVSNAPASHRDALQFQLLTKVCFGRAESIVGVTVRPFAESEW
jgi:hypothetical protein